MMGRWAFDGPMRAAGPGQDGGRRRTVAIGASPASKRRRKLRRRFQSESSSCLTDLLDPKHAHMRASFRAPANLSGQPAADDRWTTVADPLARDPGDRPSGLIPG